MGINSYDSYDMEETSFVPKRRKRKKGRAKRVFFSILILLMFLIGILCFYVTHLLNQVERAEISESDVDLGISDDAYINEEVVNVALFGVDSRKEVNEGRSDAIMVASFDLKRHKVKVVSIMRDSQVKVEGHGKTKINHAYSYGGAPLAIKTLNQNFNLNIKDYISVNFYQLADVIDAVGGLDLEITEAERRNMNTYIKEAADAVGKKYQTVKKAGLQHLTGEQVVAYARIRYVGNSDFDRTGRQREVLEKVFQKVMDESVLRWPSLLNTVLPMIETTLNNSEILGIATRAVISGSLSFEQGRFPLDGQYRSSGGNLVYDLEAASEKLHRFIYDDEPFYETEE